MNHYPLEVFWSEEDAGFIAEVRDLPGCSAWGASEVDATKEAQQAIAAWLKAAKLARREIPKPSITQPIENYSGKFILRLPKTLHARLAREAKTEGISLNQHALYKLAR